MKTLHKEWAHLQSEFEKANPFSAKYTYPTGECFYVEPIFYTMLQGFNERHANQFSLILDEMERIVKNNRKVVFTGEFENVITKVGDDFVILEILDITDRLRIFVEDKSRGSDYGD